MTLDIKEKKKMKNEKLIGKSATGMKTEIQIPEEYGESE